VPVEAIDPKQLQERGNFVNVNTAIGNLFGRFQPLSSCALILTLLLLPLLAMGQANSVQVNSNNDSFIYRDSVAVPFTAVQTTGNLNVVVVGWNDTSATIASVTDTNGNTYVLAATTESTPVPAGSSLQVSQAIYYAKNINAGVNTINVSFNQNTAVQSVRIVEYSGLDPVNPLDTSVGNFGTSSPADSGMVTTNSANDLLLGAGTVTTAFTGSGPGFVTVLLNGLGDLIENDFVTAAGSYNATAPFVSGGWVMQLVAFRLAGQTPPTLSAPAITSLSISSSPETGGAALTLTGTNFEPGGAVVFSNTTNGITAAGVNCTVTLLTAPNANISCLTPSFPPGSANITVTNVDGQVSPSSAFTFTPSTPFAAAVSPAITPDEGSTNGGTAVTISGSDFAAGAKVTVAGIPADRVSVANTNTILASVPAGVAGLGTVIVTNPSGNPGTLPGGYTYAPGLGVNFIQVNSAHPASPAANATVTYPLAQTAGNLNVVIIGWDDATANVQAVTDSAGNTYTLALPANVGTGLSQTIFYAKNIVASASNTVTVTFSVPAASPDVRVLEYSGLDTIAPLDGAAGDSGISAVLDSGPITTTTAGDLVIGGSTVGGIVQASDLIFTTVANTSDGLSVEHLVGPAAGIFDVTSTQNMNTNWVIQAVAFKQPGAIADFAMSVVPPATASVIAGASATYTVAVSALNGFNNQVTLTCSGGLPLGSSCSFAPPSVIPAVTPVNSTLTIATTAATPVGISNVTVTGTFGTLTHDTSVGLAVTTAQPPDFTVAASALSPASVPAGVSSASTITIAALNGFTGSVGLSCGITPVVTPAPTCSFNPASIVSGAGTSALTVNTSTTTPTGVYSVTVSGGFGSLTHAAAPLSLTVTAALPGDFTLSPSPLTPATVSAGTASTSTITVAPVNGFSGAVSLTCTVTPTPARAPTCSLNPTSVANSSGTSTLTVNTTAATTASLAPRSAGVFFAMWLPVGGLALLGAGFTSRRKKLWGFLFGCLIFSGLIFLTACGGSSSSGGGGGGIPGTPAGAYAITITGTSGSLTHAATASLTVQ
jgi:hypothetical protein